MVHRAMNCRATSICITDYIILFDNPIAAIFRNDPSCFAGSRMSLASCEPHSRETSNQLYIAWYVVGRTTESPDLFEFARHVPSFSEVFILSLKWMILLFRGRGCAISQYCLGRQPYLQNPRCCV